MSDRTFHLISPTSLTHGLYVIQNRCLCSSPRVHIPPNGKDQGMTKGMPLPFKLSRSCTHTALPYNLLTRFWSYDQSHMI